MLYTIGWISAVQGLHQGHTQALVYFEPKQKDEKNYVLIFKIFFDRYLLNNSHQLVFEITLQIEKKKNILRKFYLTLRVPYV